MICPYIINASLLIGGILSWGVMWPLIADRKGDWYDSKLKPSSLQGLQGYKVSHLSALKNFNICAFCDQTVELQLIGKIGIPFMYGRYHIRF